MKKIVREKSPKWVYIIVAGAYLAFAIVLSYYLHEQAMAAEIVVGLSGLIIGMVAIAITFIGLFFSTSDYEKAEAAATKWHDELIKKIDQIDFRLKTLQTQRTLKPKAPRKSKKQK